MTPFVQFRDDYSEGAHPALLDAIRDANEGQELGYGEDSYTGRAVGAIRAELGVDADVHLVSAGTQANLICLVSMLRPHEGVIAAATAHVTRHETGAIEATGHRILSVPTTDGKLTPALIDAGLEQHEGEHTVKPRVVFIAQATEEGTVYSMAELASLTAHAHARDMHVYLDGARLAMALATQSPALLSNVAATGIDMMYIGGTKNGALCGEAIAILNGGLREDFRYLLKQRGALLAKGRLLGAQFARFFGSDRLWYELGRTAVDRATRLATALRAHGVEFAAPVEVNQLFPILAPDVVSALEQHYGFHRWRRLGDGRVVIRLVCSWATTETAVDGLATDVARLLADDAAGVAG